MDQPVELQVTYWLSLLRRRAKLLIACLVGGAFLGLVAGAFGSSSYTAKTTVLLQTPLTDPNANSTPSTEFQTLAQLATSDLVKHDASAVLSGSSKLAVSVSSDNQVVTFAATAPKAADAATAANTYANAFVALSTESTARQFATAQASLQSQLDSLNQQLRAGGISDAERAALQERRGAVSGALNQLLVRQELIAGGQAYVVSPARAPRHADPRSYGTYTVVCALAALIIALVVIGVMDRRDDVLRSEHDVMGALQDAGFTGSSIVPLIPAGRHVAPENKETADVVVAPAGTADADAFTVMRFALEPEPTRKAHIIGIVEPVPGTGTTTTAANLAVAFARTGRRTALASFDFRTTPTPSLTDAFTAPQRKTSRKIIGMSRQRNRHDEPALEPPQVDVSRLYPLALQAVPGYDNLSLVTSGRLAGPEDLLRPGNVVAFLESVTQLADVVVVTLPPIMTYPDAILAAPHLDDAIIVVRTGRSMAGDVMAAVDRLRSCSLHATSILVEGQPRHGGRDADLHALVLEPREVSPLRREDRWPSARREGAAI